MHRNTDRLQAVFSSREVAECRRTVMIRRLVRRLKQVNAAHKPFHLKMLRPWATLGQHPPNSRTLVASGRVLCDRGAFWLLSGSHQIGKARVRDWWKLALRDAGLPESRRQRFARPECNADHPNESQADHHATDLHEPTC